MDANLKKVLDKHISDQSLSIILNQFNIYTTNLILSQLNPSIHTISLSHNSIQEFKGNINAFTHLETVDISLNSICDLGSLAQCQSLKHLNLSYNLFQNIEHFENLSHLKSLDIGYNNIAYIEGLDNLVNLEELILSCNKIDSLQSKIPNRSEYACKTG